MYLSPPSGSTAGCREERWTDRRLAQHIGAEESAKLSTNSADVGDGTSDPGSNNGFGGANFNADPRCQHGMAATAGLNRRPRLRWNPRHHDLRPWASVTPPTALTKLSFDSRIASAETAGAIDLSQGLVHLLDVGPPQLLSRPPCRHTRQRAGNWGARHC